jgi:hypothetical protein
MIQDPAISHRPRITMVRTSSLVDHPVIIRSVLTIRGWIGTANPYTNGELFHIVVRPVGPAVLREVGKAFMIGVCVWILVKPMRRLGIFLCYALARWVYLGKHRHATRTATAVDSPTVG